MRLMSAKERVEQAYRTYDIGRLIDIYCDILEAMVIQPENEYNPTKIGQRTGIYDEPPRCWQ